MDQSLSSIVFKGSIGEAIAAAKQQKKLFVVYISSGNPESKDLEISTWFHPNVSETLTKYCVLLHILEGSFEASQFSALYPQNSAPSITAIGYNGLKLWQREGYVAAHVLASSLEKSWLSLNVQETTAAFLTAALASGEQLASGTSEITSEQEIPGTNESSPSVDNHIPSPDIGTSNSKTTEEKNRHEDSVIETCLNQDDEPKSGDKRGNTSVHPFEIDQISREELVSPISVKNLDLQNEISQEIFNKSNGVSSTNIDETKEVDKADNATDTSAIKSNDVFLNIRLPDGFSLQVKFLVMDTLRMVKDYTKNNMISSLGSFDLAIPYPRKVFNDQELNNTLSELGLFNRQALIVVPHKQTNSHYGGGSSSIHQTYSSNNTGSSNGNEGYWALLKRILSFANPFSYFNGGSNTQTAAQDSENGIWQYSQNNDSSPDQSSRLPRDRNSDGSSSKQQNSRFGGNIHTLKNKEDDDRLNDRNTFWNGNSTEFGGNDDKK